MQDRGAVAELAAAQMAAELGGARRGSPLVVGEGRMAVSHGALAGTIARNRAVAGGVMVDSWRVLSLF